MGESARLQVAYLPYLAEQYMDNFTITPHAVSLQSVVDFGESRRLGTLIVWIDQGIADDTPIGSVPLIMAHDGNYDIIGAACLMAATGLDRGLGVRRRNNVG